MPKVSTPATPDWSVAQRHLRKVDPVLRSLIDRVGACRLSPRRDYFVALCQALYSQQISTKVAAVLFKRFRDQFPRRKPTPTLARELLRGDPSIIRTCGLSRQKHAYLLDLSERFIANDIPVRRLARMTDDEVIESLVRVKGIGRWTAEMFLMFVLNRPDVLPVDDLGLREGVKRAFKAADRPGAKDIIELAEPWRPYRSVATWYLWRGLEST